MNALAVALFVKGSLLLGVAWLAAASARRCSPSVRHWIWTLAFGALLAGPVLSRALPGLPVAVLPGAAGGARGTGAPLAAPGVPLAARAVDARRAERLPQPSPTISPEAAWAVGSLLLLLRLAAELAGLSWRTRRAVPAPRGWSGLVGRRSRFCDETRVLLSPLVSVPLVWGIARPVVLLPAAARGWTRERLRLVLLHELGHCSRRDDLGALLAQLVCALYWPNPLVWLAARRAERERERACDELTVRWGADPVRYAEQLVAIARQLGRPVEQVGVAMASRSGLASRVRSLLEAQTPRPAMTRRGALAAAALAGLLTASVAPLEPAPRASGGAPAPAGPDETGAPARMREIWLLGGREDRRALPRLVSALADGDAEVRGLAAWALGEIKDRDARAPLADALDDPDAYVREMAARALGELEDAGAVPSLRHALDDPSPEVRAAAVWALSEIDTRASLDLASAAVGDTDGRVRRMALRALAGERALARALADPDAAVRSEAAVRLGRARAVAAVPQLVSALRDSDPGVRAEAAGALGRIRDPRALDALISALRDADARVREQAIDALDEMQPSRKD